MSLEVLEGAANIVRSKENYCETTPINEDYLSDQENNGSQDLFPRTVTTSKGEEMVIALSCEVL